MSTIICAPRRVGAHAINHSVSLGGASGIGGALARTLAKQGRAVHVVGRNRATLDRLREELGALCTASLTTDVRHDGEVARVTAEAAGDVGLSALAYCIGTINLRRLGQTSLQHTVDDFVLNAATAAQCVKEALPHLRKHEHAAVLLFSTVAVAQGFPSHTSVAMAKGAVEALTRTLAAELAPKVRVNCIAPSLVATDLAKSVLGTSPAVAQALGDAHPIPRLGTPDDIAPMAALLLSPQCGWVTGQVVSVDGGRSTLRHKN